MHLSKVLLLTNLLWILLPSFVLGHGLSTIGTFTIDNIKAQPLQNNQGVTGASINVKLSNPNFADTTNYPIKHYHKERFRESFPTHVLLIELKKNDGSNIPATASTTTFCDSANNVVIPYFFNRLEFIEFSKRKHLNMFIPFACMALKAGKYKFEAKIKLFYLQDNNFMSYNYKFANLRPEQISELPLKGLTNFNFSITQPELLAVKMEFTSWVIDPLNFYSQNWDEFGKNFDNKQQAPDPYVMLALNPAEFVNMLYQTENQRNEFRTEKKITTEYFNIARYDQLTIMVLDDDMFPEPDQIIGEYSVRPIDLKEELKKSKNLLSFGKVKCMSINKLKIKRKVLKKEN